MSDDQAKGRPRRVIGVGASAGGVEPLLHLVRALPPDLPAAVCIVLHVSPSVPSLLPEILRRAATLPVDAAADGERLLPARIYVAPPDRHLLVRPTHLELSAGPKENGVRPAVDALLRSMARAFGADSIAVILSGALGDGSIGAAVVHGAGGTVVVQDPEEALVSSMPKTTMTAAPADFVRPVAELGDLLVALVREPSTRGENPSMRAPRRPPSDGRAVRPDGPPTGFTCPECSGALWEQAEGGQTRYRCRVGHAYSEGALLAGQAASVEAAMWAALEVLEERAELLRRVAKRSAAQPKSAERFEQAARDALERAELIRRAIVSGPSKGENGLAPLTDALTAGGAAE
jgi:two-component system chemotaxis response regulator CheB